jgi:hypothetical protein
MMYCGKLQSMRLKLAADIIECSIKRSTNSSTRSKPHEPASGMVAQLSRHARLP